MTETEKYWKMQFRVKIAKSNVEVKYLSNSEPTNSQDQSQEIHNLTTKAKKKSFAFEQKQKIQN